MNHSKNWAVYGVVSFLTLFLSQVGQAQPGRAPVPPEQQQKVIAEVLDGGYGVSKAVEATKKQQLVKKLAEVASDPNLPKEDLYVVLTTVISLTRELRDLRGMTGAVEQLINTFEVDPFAERTQHLVRFLEGASLKTAIALKPIYDEITTLARSEATENRFREAESLLDQVDASLTKMKVTASSRQSLIDLQKEITAMKEKFVALQKARSVLESKPDDPDANFIVGRWLVTEERAWKLALPLLAKSNNSKLWQAAAALELTPGADAEKIGNAWWDLADSEGEPAKRELLLHAGQWYEQALPNLTTLSKKLVEQRLSKNAALPMPAVNATSSSKTRSGVSNAPQTISDEGKLSTGQWIDLLANVKVPDHVLRGRWRKDVNDVICEPFPDARLQLPVALRGTYELNYEFTRRAGVGGTAVTFPVGTVSTAIVLSGWDGVASGLHLIDGRETKDLPLALRAGVRPSKLQNGHRYQIHIDVVQNNDLAAVTATLDGKVFVQWKGRVSQLSCPWFHHLSCLQAVGVGAHQSPIDIHKLEVRIRQGSKGCRLGDDWQNPIAPVASGPPKAIADKCVTWTDRKYYFSEKPMNLAEAQRLASVLEGRLLTISSVREEAFILNEGRGVSFWLSGWRRTDNLEWRDERNRPLRHPFRWAFAQPNNGEDTQLGIVTATNRDRGWHDWHPASSLHAIIEWGEEYPNGK